MYIKGNPVISRMYALSGLVLNERGLFYYHPENSSIFFMITEDHKKIAEAMGFNYEELEAAKEYEEFFILLYSNPFFRPSRFVQDISEGGSKILGDLSNYMANNPCNKGYTKRNLEDMYEPLKEFNLEERIQEFNEIYSKRNLYKLSGGDVLGFCPEFNKTNLQLGFERFNSSFKTTFERLIFFHSRSKKEIVDHFLNVYQEQETEIITL